MNGVEIKGLKEIGEQFDDAAERFPEIRRAEIERAGDDLLHAVRGYIGGTGKVQSWQEKYIGSKGGYAAVRPMIKGDVDEVGYYGRSFVNIAKYSYIGITTAVDQGHKTRTGTTYKEAKNGKKVKRATYAKKFVEGKHMYSKSQKDAETIAKKVRDNLEREGKNLLR